MLARSGPGLGQQLGGGAALAGVHVAAPVQDVRSTLLRLDPTADAVGGFQDLDVPVAEPPGRGQAGQAAADDHDVLHRELPFGSVWQCRDGPVASAVVADGLEHGLRGPPGGSCTGRTAGRRPRHSRAGLKGAVEVDSLSGLSGPRSPRVRAPTPAIIAAPRQAALPAPCRVWTGSWVASALIWHQASLLDPPLREMISATSTPRRLVESIIRFSTMVTPSMIPRAGAASCARASTRRSRRARTGRDRVGRIPAGGAERRGRRSRVRPARPPGR